MWIDSHNDKCLNELFTTIRRTAGRFGAAEDDVILLGSFERSTKEMEKLAEIPDLVAVHFDKETDLRGRSTENIIFDERATTEYVERFGVVDLERYFGFSKEEAQKVSSFRPVWADFSVYEGGAVEFFNSQARCDVR